VTRFWSLTIYNLGVFDIVANPIDRYKIGPETPGLQYDKDGSFTITLAHEQPSTAPATTNWLPIPAGRFFAMVRFYAPTEPILQLSYQLPKIFSVKAPASDIDASH